MAGFVFWGGGSLFPAMYSYFSPGQESRQKNPVVYVLFSGAEKDPKAPRACGA